MQPISWKPVAIVLGVGTVLTGGMLYVKKEKELSRQSYELLKLICCKHVAWRYTVVIVYILNAIHNCCHFCHVQFKLIISQTADFSQYLLCNLFLNRFPISVASLQRSVSVCVCVSVFVCATFVPNHDIYCRRIVRILQKFTIID